ncbi:hypothetical protein EN904_13465 [Mesorhizobium sp. M7A.F.Ca.CA.001.07.2.1]|uniref:hypothetical protein n=1 Tax=Mesorhizobium TaxID=68287 RepID=UPI000FCBC160|nr:MULTISPECIES: hypothetical protein [Mesorhizobium]RVB26858.1 hypothetical protein EN918_25825 [Mesorhizobium sp. M7A.F.Ca.CA.004.05.1.1]MCF6124383.1 hypothetical protein [Mesorhizobium ciceri]MCQ8816656.1 hypothetical protein [Mesorhizobium sp. SEMIA396]RUX82454.1 hypothetical protein EN983_01080 [Mesorhizobium sp. M7A.F.Ca.CA.004.08.2.1]RUX87217.1 hypothetical protein EN982_11745 [Mesorhizobium sp. M7A.F.Ca.CA.004.08.1.1]
MGKALIAPVFLLLSACATSAPIDDPRKVWCDHNTPRRPSLTVVQIMTRAELDDLNSFNAKGADWCGWKP